MKLLYASIMLLCGISLIAQQDINGKITDDLGLAIEDAVVYINKYENHTHSDINGRFFLKNIKAGDSLFVHFLGFERFTKKLNARDFDETLNIILKESSFMLDQVYIDNSLKSGHTVSSIDLKMNPVQSSQEVLQMVPGLFLAQHAGGGKAEQIFLRGFDIDHGTDIRLTVDGMPVNMVSHAHGQGYADLHFLIPETIENIEFGKGPYYADQGNFNTAGYVNFSTKDRLSQNMVSFEYGRFNTNRALAMMQLIDGETQGLYFAGEYLMSDGPFESSQNFKRLNFMAKYRHTLDEKSSLNLQVSSFSSDWDASGQIPQRLVDAGVITRFGAVDDTEGGMTSRTNAALEYTRILNNNTYNKLSAYVSQYDFQLFSNFTFFLEDPENSDQIMQRESRTIYGFENALNSELQWGDTEIELTGGLGFRYDDIDDNELSRTKNRIETLETLSLGDIDESNLFAYTNAAFHVSDWTINPALRLDHFNFEYRNRLAGVYDRQTQSRTILAPKLNIFYNPSYNMQLFLKSGIGFHSNDTRVVIEGTADEILPAAYSLDLGMQYKPLPNLWFSTSLWYLALEQEFVYVGDAGIVEPSGRTRRQGVDLGIRYQLGDHLYLNYDINYTYARAIDEAEGEDFIPLAPDLTAVAGINYVIRDKLTAGLNMRYIKDRPANEDNSIIAEGYFVTDLNVDYNIAEHVGVGLIVNNLFNTEWNEAQFATLSQLKNEAEPVEEIHFTPGTPFAARMRVYFRF